MTKQHVLVIGGGMASVKFVEELHAAAPDAFAITVVCEEPQAAYNRVLLSPLLAGEITEADLALKPNTWFDAAGCTLRTSTTVTAIDQHNKTAALAAGETLGFDHCVIATGSDPIRLTVPGAALPGVDVFRTTRDAENMLACASSGEDVIVIGGGLLGIEAAYGLHRAGARVTLIHLMDRLMERQLDSAAADILRRQLEAKGIKVCLKAETMRIVGADRVTGLTLKDGRHFPASNVVMAIGIRPRTELGVAANLTVKRGIVVDDDMRTSADTIYAIGECAEHRGQVYGLVEPAYQHARTAARAIAGTSHPYAGTTLATNLKVSGVPVFSVGCFDADDADDIILRDDAASSYRRFLIKDGALIGVVMIGDTTDALWYRDLIADRTPITEMRTLLAFGRAYAEAA